MRTSLVAAILFAVIHARQRAHAQQLRILNPPGDNESPSTQYHVIPRANTASGTTAHELTLRLGGPNITYTAEFGIGTPPQKIELGISSIALSSLRLHDGPMPPCDGDGCLHGTYDPNVSSSSRGGDKDTMQNSEGAYGQLFKDTWQIGNTKVGNVSFRGTANDLGAWAFVGLGGIMDTQNDSLTTMTAALVAAGLSTTSAYSVWLGDLAGKAGSLVFGSIDTQKFKGTLTRLKTYSLQLNKSRGDSLGVQLSAVLAVSVTGTDVLDCGTRPLLVEIFMGSSGIFLPDDLVEAIYKEVGATSDPDRDGMAIIPCHMGNSPAYFSFVFSSAAEDGAVGTTVNVSMSSLVMPSSLNIKSVSKDMFSSPQNPICQFAIVKGNDTFGLGEAFIRSTYVVFDQENREVGIAQSNPTPSGSYIIRFPSKGALIPLATPAAQPTGAFPTSVVTSSIAPLPTYSAAEGFQHWETAQPPLTTNTTNADDGDDQQSSSKGLAIGLGVGLPCSAVAVFTGFMAYWRLKLKRPLPILKHFSKRRWVNPYATELEVKHPQPEAAEVVGFPWAFDRPVGWTELDAPVNPVELEGDHSYHRHHPFPCRQDTLSSSTAVDTEEARSAIARRESMIIPGRVSVATSPVDERGSTARDSGSYIASALASPLLRMSFIPGPDRIDIGVLADHPENYKETTPNLPDESKDSSSVAATFRNNSESQDASDQDGPMEGCEDITRRTPSYTTSPCSSSLQPPATPPPSDPRWL